MTIRDLIPFNWRRERNGESERALARRDSDDNQLSPFAMMQRDMDRIFDDFFRAWPSAWQEPALSPRMNVTETADAYEIEAELPGLEEKDIDVRVEQGRLHIHGVRNDEKREEKKGRVHRIERSYGSFERTLPLPDTVKADEATANYRNGVLTITLPKDADKAPATKRIPVKSG